MPKERFRYLAAFMGTGLATGLVVVLLTGAGGPAEWLLGGISGAAIGAIWVHLAAIPSSRTQSCWPLRNLRLHVRHLGSVAVAGVAAAAVVMAAAMFVEREAAAAITALTAIAAAIFLGGLDAATVRFMAMVGHSSITTIRDKCLPILSFFVPFSLLLLLYPDWLIAGTGAGLGLLSLAFMIVRVLAYRSFRQRVADWVVTFLFALTATTAISMPPAAPLIYLAGCMWLVQRATGISWLVP